uniref:Putative secreted protein n=1 Tax=Anopheles triannulatus TaxID=58253 RepID=A0A2M4B5Y0_9DIPT
MDAMCVSLLVLRMVSGWYGPRTHAQLYHGSAQQVTEMESLFLCPPRCRKKNRSMKWSRSLSCSIAGSLVCSGSWQIAGYWMAGGSECRCRCYMMLIRLLIARFRPKLSAAAY